MTPERENDTAEVRIPSRDRALIAYGRKLGRKEIRDADCSDDCERDHSSCTRLRWEEPPSASDAWAEGWLACAEGDSENDNPYSKSAPVTIAEFLLARIAEDESDMSRGARVKRFGSRGPVGYVSEPRALRALAECEAKRRVVLDCQDAWEQRRPSGKPTEWGRHAWGGLEQACRHLAAVYADHPDYDETWKP